MEKRLKRVAVIAAITMGAFLLLAIVLGVLNALVGDGRWNFGWNDYRYDDEGYEVGEGTVPHTGITAIDLDWIDGGVEIVACPPGKKLTKISLLSGGERALTAIAILFAILKSKPMPFCILDEIEAALDDANVDRFASYLKRFSEDTQFIVITHRKPTMNQADVLFGVTMQEKGVSKIVSVKLAEVEEKLGAGTVE